MLLLKLLGIKGGCVNFGWSVADILMGGMRAPPKTLPILLIANLVASALHFGGNMLRFEAYPKPKWITGPHLVDALWLVITPLLAVGWWFARRQRKWASVGILWLYGALSMCVLGHYFYASPSELTFRINFLILLEASAAALLILLAPLSIQAPPPVFAAAGSSGPGPH